MTGKIRLIAIIPTLGIKETEIEAVNNVQIIGECE
jgi:hypothetical protein